MGSVLAQRYYHTKEVYGKSIPATEHSICTQLGKEGELDIFKNVLKTFPSGLVACVSDSYDIFKACEEYWGENLKTEILEREGTLVIRPDSGDPIRTLLEIFKILFDKFGYTTNPKGFKVLPPQVRVIQGDGVNYDTIIEMYQTLKEAGISAENLVLGMGGALLQKLDRDTQKYAIKCSYVEVNGKGIIVQKAPTEMDKDGNITESFKKSKGGLLKLIKQGNTYKTVTQETITDEQDELVTVFKNDELVKEYTFEEVRENAKL